MAVTTELSRAIFNNAAHYRTAPFGEVRAGGRIHVGTDYGTNGINLPLYCPYDNGNVVQVVNTEAGSGDRGCQIRIEWSNLNLGMRMQHLVEGSIPKNVGDTCALMEFVGNTGTTGSSTGIHLHVEVYYLDSGGLFNFESINYDNPDLPGWGGGSIPGEGSGQRRRGILKYLQYRMPYGGYYGNHRSK